MVKATLTNILVSISNIINHADLTKITSFLEDESLVFWIIVEVNIHGLFVNEVDVFANDAQRNYTFVLEGLL